MDAIVNTGPREDSTRIGSQGTVRRQAVDVSPLRRVNQSIALLTIGVSFVCYMANWLRRMYNAKKSNMFMCSRHVNRLSAMWNPLPNVSQTSLSTPQRVLQTPMLSRWAYIFCSSPIDVYVNVQSSFFSFPPEKGRVGTCGQVQSVKRKKVRDSLPYPWQKSTRATEGSLFHMSFICIFHFIISSGHLTFKRHHSNVQLCYTLLELNMHRPRSHDKRVQCVMWPKSSLVTWCWQQLLRLL